MFDFLSKLFGKRDDYHTIQELQDHVRALGGNPLNTLDELYRQRTELSIEFFNRTQSPKKWKFISEPGWFAYGVELSVGLVGYHAPIEYWDQMDAPVTEAFEIDDKTLERLVVYNFGNQHRNKFPSLR
jgi:hypothetical protein